MLLTLVLALTFFGAHQRAGPADDTTSVVRGTVTDINQAVVFGAKVLIFNEERRIELTTDPNGEFQSSVQPGVYQIQALAPHFCTTNRAPFEVAAKSTVTINLMLVVAPIVNSVYTEPGAKVSETDRPECPFRVDKIPLRRTRKVGAEVWVQFGESKQIGAMNCYSGYFSDRMPQRVIVSYDLFTLYADRVCLNEQQELLAFGRLHVERGDGKLQSLNVGDTLNYKELVVRASSK